MTTIRVVAMVLMLLWPVPALAGVATLRWSDLSTDETGFIISRRPDCGSGTFVDIVTTAANVSLYTDLAAPEPIAEYRVRATNGSESTNTNTACWSLWKHGGLTAPANHGTRPAPPGHGSLP